MTAASLAKMDLVRSELARHPHPQRIHLFLAGPGGLALLLGHRWNRTRENVVYEHLGAGRGYTPAFTVDARTADALATRAATAGAQCGGEQQPAHPSRCGDGAPVIGVRPRLGGLEHGGANGRACRRRIDDQMTTSDQR